eukprot:11925667-Heterocapsa_arctica.AAC.1
MRSSRSWSRRLGATSTTTTTSSSGSHYRAHHGRPGSTSTCVDDLPHSATSWQHVSRVAPCYAS